MIIDCNRMEAPKKKRRLVESPEMKPPFKVETLEDLLDLAWNYRGDSYDWFSLWRLIPPLTKLQRMVGMESLKKSIVDHIIYCVQKLHEKNGKMNDKELLHTVIYGPPGCGKSTVAHILAEIYCGLGILPTDNIIVAGKEDFIGKYIGHSESKTTALLKKALGGVLFIDEVYSLGYSGNGKTDSFSKVIIDLLNRFLSEHQGEFICIIAGYKKDINESFFAVNKGLRRRFPIRFEIKGYTPTNLLDMFKQKIKENGWKLEDNTVGVKFFEKNKKHLKFFGGDIENLLSACKKAHSRRIFGTLSEKKLLTNKDVISGLKIFLENSDEGESNAYEHLMYM